MVASVGSTCAIVLVPILDTSSERQISSKKKKSFRNESFQSSMSKGTKRK